MTATFTIPLEQHQEEIKKLQGEITHLKEQLDWFRRQLFEQRSEKFIDDSNGQQLFLNGFDGLPSPVKPKKQIIPEHERKKPNRDEKDKITIPENVPVESK